MDSINSIIPGIKSNALTQKTGDVVLKLQQSGTFRAVVIENRHNHAVLDTAYGKISVRTSSNLQKGDEILARILSSAPQATIKVVQHKPLSWILPRQTLNKLDSLNISLPVVAKITIQSANINKLQIGNQAVMVQGKAPDHIGQKVMLTMNTNRQLVAKPFDAQSILKHGLIRLLTNTQLKPSVQNLTSLQKLAIELMHADTGRLNARVSDLAANQTIKSRAEPAAADSSTAVKPDNTSVSASQLKSMTRLQALMENLALPVLHSQSAKADSIQQMMLFLSLLKPTSVQHQVSTAKLLPDLLKELMNQLKTSPQSFEKLIRQIFLHPATTPAAAPDQPMQTFANSLRQEFFAHTEQVLNQILLQKTSVALQAEQNQPFQLHLNVPVEHQHDTRNLKLSIREKTNEDEASEQKWEVDLSFDFSNLGLIHTHIVLQDSRLSACFRAEQESTWALIDHHLPEFQSQIINSGFEPGIFECQHGPVFNEDEKLGPVAGGENYVDINV